MQSEQGVSSDVLDDDAPDVWPWPAGHVPAFGLHDGCDAKFWNQPSAQTAQRVVSAAPLYRPEMHVSHTASFDVLDDAV